MSKKLIKTIFKNRNKAIDRKDKKLFLSSQIKNQEIKGSYSKGYLELSMLKSKVLHLFKDDKDNKLWIVLVKEKYYKKGKFSHQGYLMYKIICENNKFLIFDIRW